MSKLTWRIFMWRCTLHSSLCKSQKFTLTQKIRQINYLVISVVNCCFHEIFKTLTRVKFRIRVDLTNFSEFDEWSTNHCNLFSENLWNSLRKYNMYRDLSLNTKFINLLMKNLTYKKPSLNKSAFLYLDLRTYFIQVQRVLRVIT